MYLHALLKWKVWSRGLSTIARTPPCSARASTIRTMKARLKRSVDSMIRNQDGLRWRSKLPASTIPTKKKDQPLAHQICHLWRVVTFSSLVDPLRQHGLWLAKLWAPCVRTWAWSWCMGWKKPGRSSLFYWSLLRCMVHFGMTPNSCRWIIRGFEV